MSHTPKHPKTASRDQGKIPTAIMDVSQLELARWLEERGIQAYRATQILQWVYERQTDSFGEMTNIHKDLRNQLSKHFTIHRLKCLTSEQSDDGTVKYLFELQDDRRIESVLIPEKNHYTLCISSQVGCAQNCKFCFTARNGFMRNLSSGEITAQVRDLLMKIEGPKRLTNIVFMGMGEPLANYRNLVKAIEVLTDNTYGLRFAHRRITVSTAGIAPKLIQLGQETQVNLAVSLNATTNQIRNTLMPINRAYPIESLLDACRQYPIKKGRRITFEYILIKGVNDSADDARRLARLLKPHRCKINLIPFNEHPGNSFRRPSDQAILRFEKILLAANFTTIIRHSKGQDISAACGQLHAAYGSDRQ
jgi:23S rRNA (adenine2503-C2)-methyltransferase